jgi:DNA-binding GntR family transcriptional regulator
MKRIPKDVLKEMFPKKLKRDLPSEMLYNKLKQRIVSGKLRTGTKLVQNRIVQEFGISRGPVVRAFGRLRKERLIVVKPRTGAFVK